MESTIFTIMLNSFFSLMGMLGNLFILVMNLIDWRATGEFNPCALIVSTLGVSNIFLQMGMLTNEVSFFASQSYYFKNSVVNTFIAVLTSLFFCSLLFTVCLCFYYFVKIVQCSQPFFQKLKTKINKIVPWLLVGSVLFSFALGLPSYWDLHMHFFMGTNVSRNGTPVFNYNFESSCHCIFYLYIWISSVIFVIFLSLTLSIIISLGRHMRRMKKNNDSIGNTSIKAHLTAAKTLSSLLLLYVYFFVALNFLFQLSTLGGSWLYSFFLLMVSGFPSLNSFILIMGNSKLRESMKKLIFNHELCASQNDPKNTA
ncbi:taste receptor type 2 member 40-like [Pelodytes ibericus]